MGSSVCGITFRSTFYQVNYNFFLFLMLYAEHLPQMNLDSHITILWPLLGTFAIQWFLAIFIELKFAQLIYLRLHFFDIKCEHFSSDLRDLSSFRLYIINMIFYTSTWLLLSLLITYFKLLIFQHSYIDCEWQTLTHISANQN